MTVTEESEVGKKARAGLEERLRKSREETARLESLVKVKGDKRLAELRRIHGRLMKLTEGAAVIEKAAALIAEHVKVCSGLDLSSGEDDDDETPELPFGTEELS